MKDEIAPVALKWTLIALAGFILMIFMINSESFRIMQGEQIEQLQAQVEQLQAQIEAFNHHTHIYSDGRVRERSF